MDLGLKGNGPSLPAAARDRPGHRRGFAAEGACVSICARKADEVAATVAALKAKASRPLGARSTWPTGRA